MDLFNIYNENYGRTVATTGKYIVVGNPSSDNFNMNDGFSRIGEVTVYKKNENDNGYSIHFRCSASIASVRERGFFTKDDYTKTLCGESLIEGNVASTKSLLYQSKYGTAIDVCDNLLVVGDYSCSIEKNPTEPDSFVNFGRVDIYNIDIPGSKDNDYYKEPLFTLDPYTNTPYTDGLTIDSRYGLRENNNINDYCRGYGYSVAISKNYIFVGCPFAIDNTKFANDVDSSYISPIENSTLKPNVHGVVFAYRYTYKDGNFSFVRDDGSYLHRDYYFNPEVITPNENFYNNFGYYISADKTEDLDNPEVIYDETINKYQTSSLWYECKSSRVLISSFRQYRSGTTVYNEPVVYLLNNFDSGWMQSNMFTSSVTTNIEIDFIEPKSYIQFDKSKFDLFGISTAMNNDCIVIGSPTDITYTEFSSASVYTPQHDRGSVYVYLTCGSHDNPRFLKKVFGGPNSLKDNFFGVSVDVYRKDEENEYIVIGSPRASIDYTTEFISSSVYSSLYNDASKYPTDTDFNGQVILYKIINGGCLVNGCYDERNIELLNEYPINSRKEYGKSYNLFGFSAGISDYNIVVGAPLNELYCLTCDREAKDIEAYQVEDNSLENIDGIDILFERDTRRLYEIQGRVYVYNFSDYIENYKVGNVFYNNNKLIINTKGNICDKLISDPALNDKKISLNGTIKGKLHLHEMQYICTIEPGEFNISTNLTAREIKDFNYKLTNKFKFTFEDVDYILRYINLKTNNNEKWWEYIIEDSTEKSILDYYNLNNDFRNNLTKLTSKPELLNYIENNLLLDVNEDDCTDDKDAKIIWKYFINTLSIDNYKLLTSFNSKVTDYDDIISKLDKYTGKNLMMTINPEFFKYGYSSSVDVTGSYLAPYITQVGLYNNAELLAVAKLANPIKNTGDLPINIVVKFDY